MRIDSTELVRRGVGFRVGVRGSEGRSVEFREEEWREEGGRDTSLLEVGLAGSDLSLTGFIKGHVPLFLI